MLIFLPVEARNLRTCSLIECYGHTKINALHHAERRAWAVPSEDVIPYWEFDFSQVDAVCFGDDALGHLPFADESDARFTIPGLLFPIYNDQAMAIIFEHLRRGRK